MGMGNQSTTGDGGSPRPPNIEPPKPPRNAGRAVWGWIRAHRRFIYATMTVLSVTLAGFGIRYWRTISNDPYRGAPAKAGIAHAAYKNPTLPRLRNPWWQYGRENGKISVPEGPPGSVIKGRLLYHALHGPGPSIGRHSREDVPYISEDGKLSFVIGQMREPHDENPQGYSALLIDVDKDTLAWRYALAKPSDCADLDDEACIELDKARTREVNEHLAQWRWYKPWSCDITEPPPHPDCGLVDDLGGYCKEREEPNQTCKFGSFTATFHRGRLRVVDAKGRIVIAKHYAAWGPPGDKHLCSTYNWAELRAWGYDLVRRVLFVTLHYWADVDCQPECKTPKEGCDIQPRIHHVFRLPPDPPVPADAGVDALSP